MGFSLSDWQEYSSILFYVFGGCCSNVFSLEALLQENPGIGSVLSFSQSLFISTLSLPSFIEFTSWRPRLKARHVPMKMWLLHVVLLCSVALLNNWALKFRVPLAIQILMRSAGLSVAMAIGYFYLNKRYTLIQVIAVIMVSIGVVLATLSKPTPPHSSTLRTRSDTAANYEPSVTLYVAGVSMLAFSLVLSGILGALQERTFATYGPHWREGVFYTHALSVPIFAVLPEVKHGIRDSFSRSAAPREGGSTVLGTLFVLAVNLITQSVCVKGVNRLTSKMSSVSTNLVLTGRKALSLCLSVWWFGAGWNNGMSMGASLVFLGSILYGWGGRDAKSTKDPKEALEVKNK